MSLTERDAAAENERDDQYGDGGVEVVALWEGEEVDREAREDRAHRAQRVAQQVQEHRAQILRRFFLFLHCGLVVRVVRVVVVRVSFVVGMVVVKVFAMVRTAGATSRFGSALFQGRDWIGQVLVFVLVAVLVRVFVAVTVAVRMTVRVAVVVVHARVTDEHEQSNQIHSETGETNPHDQQRVIDDCNLDEALYRLYSNVEAGGDEEDAVDQPANNFRSTPAVREFAALFPLCVLYNALNVTSMREISSH